MEYVDRLTDELVKRSWKLWIDREDIQPTSNWWAEILRAIDESSIFIAIVSHSSTLSDVCKQELEYANKKGKKIVPVLIEDSRYFKLPTIIQGIQCVPWDFSKPINDNIERLIFAIKIDLDWYVMQTSLSKQAKYWAENAKNKDFLLRGKGLSFAESWLDKSDEIKNYASTTHVEFIVNSRKNSARNNLLPALGILIFLILFTIAISLLGKQLKQPETPLGIMSIELSDNSKRNADIVTTWQSQDLIDTAKFFVLLDCLYVFIYVSFYVFCIKYFVTAFKRRNRVISVAGRIIIGLVLLGGSLDLLENFLIFKTLQGTYVDLLSVTRFSASMLKFFLMFLGSAYLSLSLIYSFFVNKRQMKKAITR